MNRTIRIALAVFLLAAWFIGGLSVAAFMLYKNTTAPVVFSATKVEDFKIRFGILEMTSDGHYTMAQETTTLPLKMKETGFRFGVVVDPPDNQPYTYHSVVHLPAKPKTVTDNLTLTGNDLATATITAKGQEIEYFNFDPGDPTGHQSIDIYINDRLAKTVHFDVVPDE